MNFKARAESLASKVHIGMLGFTMACSPKPPPSSMLPMLCASTCSRKASWAVTSRFWWSIYMILKIWKVCLRLGLAKQVANLLQLSVWAMSKACCKQALRLHCCTSFGKMAMALRVWQLSLPSKKVAKWRTFTMFLCHLWKVKCSI